jgi:aerobic carbon-monoxide dehydrogenase small subunit
MQVSLTVNGSSHTADVEPRVLLAEVLRDSLGLTGTKIGCETSQCGSCTVLLNGTSVKSCSLLAVQAEGSEITTIEGIAENGHLNAVQEGFWEKHGLQCGFCTPGMVMSIVDLLRANPDPSEADVREWLQGNLCRCTGYQNVVNAVQYAARKMQSSVNLVADTPAKEIYQRQVDFMLKGDAEGLVDSNYHDDAMVVSHEFVVKGKDALKEHFRQYLKWVHIQEVKSTDHFTEADNTIFFEATVRSNFGIVRVFDVWVLNDGKIRYHFTGIK